MEANFKEMAGIRGGKPGESLTFTRDLMETSPKNVGINKLSGNLTFSSKNFPEINGENGDIFGGPEWDTINSSPKGYKPS